MTPATWAAGEARYSGATSDIPESVFSNFPGERGSTVPTVPGPNGGNLAAGEPISAAVRERLARWKTLCEISGETTPFGDKIRVEVERKLRDAHRAELDSLRTRCDAELAEMERTQRATQVARVRDRLLQLAGFARRGEEEKPS